MFRYLSFVILLSSCFSERIEKNKFCYSIRNDSVFYLDDFILEADAENFEILDSNYAKDKKNVYFGDQVFEGVDVNSFSVLEQGYSKDINCIYYLHDSKNKLCDLSIETFEIIDFEFCKDSMNVYVLNEQLQMEKLDVADASTFIKCGDLYYCDQNYLFTLNGEIIARRDTFDVERFLKITK